ncbi:MULTISPECIES: TM0106 family RecB-like putative nuclease [Mycobacteriaceae]|uniref:TM0106 family RecB-like putative nuclease n=1 Tax=Mycolicibacterium parafortuitum TaxID=39692 RepID=A0ACC6MP44_MYCPF|nr:MULTISPECIES: TM0106 family RecB-like putative nuclease [Mycobacteriaceae]MDZ5088718.1 TM0106 family RecB-like putative nuclease [Mycolicibacterium parafortuitum]
MQGGEVEGAKKTLSPAVERVVTPSKVSAWLECPHYITLTSRVDEGLLDRPTPTFGSFAQLLADKGLVHEQQCLDEYRRRDKTVFEVPPRRERETFTAWVKRIGNPLAMDYDVVYQMPFVHDGIRGIADFVERVTTPDGHTSFEPVDAKLTRTEAKPGHVLQLCFYAEAIAHLTGAVPEQMHIWLGSGCRESLPVDEFQPYWRRLRSQLFEALAASPSAETTPRRCNHCPFCEFNAMCEHELRAADSLIYIAGILQTEVDTLVGSGTTTLTDLAARPPRPDGLRAERLNRLIRQAELQVQARLQDVPPYEVVTPSDDPVWGHGFEEMPSPDDGDVFLDFEGHPFWRADTGLFFLFGLIERDEKADWVYRTWWAHDLPQEAAAAQQLIDHLSQRRVRFPNMHVYHYNHTERTALRTMAETHGVGEEVLSELIRTGTFVDLYLVARNSIQVGTESYGLKHLERLTDFRRSHDIDKGAGAVVQYEEYMRDGDASILTPIAAYNEDDVRATMALRDWLVDQRSPDLEWRDSHLEPPPGIPALDERVPKLHAYPAGSVERFLGDLLGYWWREYMAYHTPIKARLQQEIEEVIDDPDSIAGLQPVGLVERLGAKGTPITPTMRFLFPPQNLERFPRDGGTVAMLGPEANTWMLSVARLDREEHAVELVWGEKLQQAEMTPRSVVLYEWVDAKPKAFALQAFTDDILDRRPPNEVTMALLRRDLPKFIGAGPAGGLFSADLADMREWATRLDRSYVAVQGPPGAGKTYTAAQLIHALVVAGARVGITATSHHAIGNLLEAVVEAFEECGDIEALRAVRKPSEGAASLPYVTHCANNPGCAGGDYNLVAGTAWLFSSPDMRAAPVDILFIDEAGQMALADALAASTAARNLILLGDPQQLPQVAQAIHPNSSGVSVLDHVIGEHATLSADRGVFLPETRRMHPDVTAFISQQFYDGRLGSHASCEGQSTAQGTGLRWILADHVGNKTSSQQEADLIVDRIADLMGTPWTNHHGETSQLGPGDFMVVAPYNDQVRLIRERLGTDGRLCDVPVGTVDKFQGREAAVVFYSMTTSSSADMTRGADFLFSRNRLNVALSRARCLAYVVCTEELLRARARSVEDMRLISSLNAFVEYADTR